MNNVLGKKIDLFIDIEITSAGIYSDLAVLCNKHSQLLQYLSKVEENHATVAVIAKRYFEKEKLPEDFLHGRLSDMERILESAKELRAAIKNKNISIDEAFQRVLSLEEATCLIYCKELKEKETTSEVILALQRMITDTDAHILFLRGFVNNKKYR